MPPPSALRGSARRHEDSSSSFVRAPGLTAAETSERLGALLARALENLAKDQPLAHPTVTVDRLMRWHRAVFGPLFAREAGRPRHSYEEVVFSNLYTDETGEEYQRVFHGSPGKNIKARLETACGAFVSVQQRHAAGTAELPLLALGLAELMAEILRIHPFLDGNHRITLLAMQAVIRDVTGTIVVIPDNDGLGGDLELALLGPGYAEPLAERIVHVLTSAA
jgi:fido (protein-threonine AMPylation protein)